MATSRKAPSLVELCVGTVIANLRYVGNVSGIEMHLLAEVLPHCTVDQLMHIEGSTEEIDLSPVTNDLWKRFYKQQFGEENTKLVVGRMAQKQVFFKWRNLYKAKTKEREEFQNKSAVRLKQRYEKELAKKQSKQIQICSKIPPSGSKRSFSSVSGSTYNVSHIKGNLMKKARLEFLKSNEARIRAAMKKNVSQRRGFPPRRETEQTNPSLFKDSTSGGKRSFSSVGSSTCNVSHIKGNLMNKEKLEFLKSNETRIHASMNKNVLQRRGLPPQSSSQSISYVGKSSALTSKLSK